MPDFVQQALAFAREGFVEVNAVQGLIIAAVAALLLSRWSRLPVIAVGSVIAHIALDVLSPVFAEVGDLRLPPLLEPDYWRYVGLLGVGYLIVVGILFAIKRVVVKG